LFFAAYDGFRENKAADGFCSGMQCINFFHEYNFGKMNRGNGIELVSFGIEKVLKKYGK